MPSSGRRRGWTPFIWPRAVIIIRASFQAASSSASHLARALANRPKLLLADEPTGNLDQATGADIVELMFGIQRERDMTLLLITHESALAERVVIIDIAWRMAELQPTALAVDNRCLPRDKPRGSRFVRTRWHDRRFPPRLAPRQTGASGAVSSGPSSSWPASPSASLRSRLLA